MKKIRFESRVATRVRVGVSKVATKVRFESSVTIKVRAKSKVTVRPRFKSQVGG